MLEAGRVLEQDDRECVGVRAHADDHRAAGGQRRRARVVVRAAGVADGLARRGLVRVVEEPGDELRVVDERVLVFLVVLADEVAPRPLRVVDGVVVVPPSQPRVVAGDARVVAGEVAGRETQIRVPDVHVEHRPRDVAADGGRRPPRRRVGRRVVRGLFVRGRLAVRQPLAVAEDLVAASGVRAAVRRDEVVQVAKVRAG